MFQNDQNPPFAGAQLQKKLFKQNNLKGESPCLRINSYGMKLLKACWGWQRIFCGFVHHEFSHKHVIVADLISRLEKGRSFKTDYGKKYPQGGWNLKVCRQTCYFDIWLFLKILNRYCVPTIPRGQYVVFSSSCFSKARRNQKRDQNQNQ